MRDDTRQKLLTTLNDALSLLIVLGDYIGNGTDEDTDKRCRTILAIRSLMDDSLRQEPLSRDHVTHCQQSNYNAIEAIKYLRQQIPALSLADAKNVVDGWVRDGAFVPSGSKSPAVLLREVHAPHPQPEACDACKFLGR